MPCFCQAFPPPCQIPYLYVSPQIHIFLQEAVQGSRPPALSSCHFLRNPQMLPVNGYDTTVCMVFYSSPTTPASETPPALINPLKVPCVPELHKNCHEQNHSLSGFHRHKERWHQSMEYFRQGEYNSPVCSPVHRRSLHYPSVCCHHYRCCPLLKL